MGKRKTVSMGLVDACLMIVVLLVHITMSIARIQSASLKVGGGVVIVGVGWSDGPVVIHDSSTFDESISAPILGRFSGIGERQWQGSILPSLAWKLFFEKHMIWLEPTYIWCWDWPWPGRIQRHGWELRTRGRIAWCSWRILHSIQLLRIRNNWSRWWRIQLVGWRRRLLHIPRLKLLLLWWSWLLWSL